MILEQFYLACLSHASYLIGDESSHTAVVVDPQRDVEQYLAAAARHGLTIRHVVLTHFHADFAAGHLELAARCAATIHLGARAHADFAFQARRDGDELTLGRVRLRVLETPGHTPESISLLVFDGEARAPHAVLTGDTLFIGDVGRPDLLVSIGCSAEELAEQLYASLRDKLMPLDDATLVYPAHGAGSACGKNLSKETSSTLGQQKRLNWALQPLSRAQFVAELTSAQPSAPAYFAFDADFNRRAHATLDTVLARSSSPLSLAELLRLANAGALVLDTREPSDYARQHLVGSTNIGLSGKFAHWAGELIAPSQRIVLIADPGSEREATVRLARIGFDHVVGYLEGGAAAFATRPELVRSHPRIDAHELRRRLESPQPPLVVDVRTRAEWDAGHIANARHEPLPKLRELCARLPRERELVVQCQGGYRSSIACSLLEQAGFDLLTDLEGGWNAWVFAGGAVER
ncbi:MAG: MBL fold metallo-hydrolase [Planctomycetes bacterium]|nr:MBL fold metallo-hydrolase [Planctomycetota bacterium]